MYNIQVIKNTFNLTQHRKYDALLKLIKCIDTISTPSNSGKCPYTVKHWFSNTNAMFNNTVVRKEAGNAYITAYIQLNPSLLTNEQLLLIEEALQTKNPFKVLAAQ